MPQKKDKPIPRRFGLNILHSDMLNNMIVDKVHIDTKTNWILGVAALIMSLTLSTLKNGYALENLGFIIIFISSLISFLFSLVIFHIPNFMRKIPHSDKSIMYYSSYKQRSPDEFASKLSSIKTMSEVSDQYAYNIANLVNRNNYLKRKLLCWPIYILFVGVLSGCVLILVFLF